MSTKYFILLFSLVKFAQTYGGNSCLQSELSDHYWNNSDTIHKEIPTGLKGKPTWSYIYDSQKAAQLGLDDLARTGYDSIQIRIWFDYSMAIERHLIILKKSKGKWTCDFWTVQSKMNSTTDSQVVISSSVRQIDPKMGWSDFIGKLDSLHISTLPNGPGGGMDGASYNIEVATNDTYRYYSYWSPETTQAKFWGSRNMVEIIRLIEKVCEFKRNQE
jgi:hypothetical protein